MLISVVLSQRGTCNATITLAQRLQLFQMSNKSRHDVSRTNWDVSRFRGDVLKNVFMNIFAPFLLTKQPEGNQKWL